MIGVISFDPVFNFLGKQPWVDFVLVLAHTQLILSFCSDLFDALCVSFSSRNGYGSSRAVLFYYVDRLIRLERSSRTTDSWTALRGLWFEGMVIPIMKSLGSINYWSSVLTKLIVSVDYNGFMYQHRLLLDITITSSEAFSKLMISLLFKRYP